ncbi:uncharacterized protein LOC115451978 [Manduca sexta]|uniref:uncharacterized protein LOC115451978 n=1 Tax=Manduca sexta TaxID=7130 RepID=UPI00188F2E22|nr:uncharacterized protein LOC115451978 [Manduca sexta]XP_037292296.1 uncharacterized protein LOC115451978 [Manduca sexta]
MGSAKVSNATITMGDNDKKGFNFLKKLKLFGKKEKKEEKRKEEKKEPKIDAVLEQFQNLDIKKEKEEDDESQFFSYKVVKDDARSDRIDSQSSEDSGFVEPKAEDDVADAIKNLKIEDSDKTNVKNAKEESEKKTKIVKIIRQPTRNKVSVYRSGDPYTVRQSETSFRQQISQINQHTLTGGHILVNANQVPDNYSEVDIALKSVEKISQKRQKDKEYLEDVLELINNDTKASDDFLSEFVEIQGESCDPIHIVPTETPEPNPVEEFSSYQHIYNHYEDFGDMTNMILGVLQESQSKTHIFPTPPRSENVPSPMSESQASFYRSNSDYTLSPERSSPICNSDYEKYQDLTSFDEFPNSNETVDKRERTSSISSMTMKQFKDMQKDIANGFSKKECCDVNRKSCKEIFQEHLSKMKMVERKNLVLKVAKLDLNTAYGVLQNILLSLSRGAEQEDLQYSLFALICERVLAQKPALFAHDFGLSLLKSAALRCPHRPLLTRYIVQCIRVAIKIDSTVVAGKDSVFQEVDAQGDTLVIACARAGDAYAAVLAEIVRKDADQLPLFRIHHANTDGYTALHVSCSQHSARAPRLHTVHVLLHHGDADVWKGDVKGGDTALHLAVNSANCDIQLIMMLFKNIDRKQWKSLAHCRNMSSVTPLEYARSATKSTTRQNYPQEVLDFLKKCR